MFDDYLRMILQNDTIGHIVIFLGKPSLLTERFVRRMSGVVGEDLFWRVIILPQQSLTQYFRYCSVTTAILQSPAYSGKITTLDGFLYGVPSVAQTGELLIQRYENAFYKELGISGPSVSSKEAYVEQAVKLGTDEDYRARAFNVYKNLPRLFALPRFGQKWYTHSTESSSVFSVCFKKIHMKGFIL